MSSATPTRSLRQRSKDINYAEDDQELDTMLGVSAERHRPDIHRLLRKIKSSPCTELRSEKNPDIFHVIRSEGFRRPYLIRGDAFGTESTAQHLGIKFPPKAFSSPYALTMALGHESTTMIPTIDVATQDAGPQLTVHQLAEYYETPPSQRPRLLNIVSMSLADTPLAVRRKIL